MEKEVLAASRLGGTTQDILGEMWQEVRERGGNLSFRIVSGSMSPVIEVNDIIRVSRVEPSRIRIGDIVAFQNGRNVVVHRVIGKRWSGQRLRFRQRGDACRSSARFPAQNLIGKVTVIQKEGQEICLDSPGQVIANRVIGWRLWLVDFIGRKLRRPIRKDLRKTF